MVGVLIMDRRTEVGGGRGDADLGRTPAPRILTGGAEKQQGTEIQQENGINNLFFDALSVKINISDDDPQELLDFIKFFSMELQVAPDRTVQGSNSYSSAIHYDCEEGKVILSFGGATPNMGALIETKGYASCLLVSKIINIMPVGTWHLTRADVTVDFIGGKKTFRKIHKKLIKYAKDNRITAKCQQGDWIDQVGGRTQYIGAKSSEYRFRLYEKSEERWANGEKDYPAERVRLEWQYRPKRRKKEIIQLFPEYVLSFSANASALFNSVLDLSIAPTKAVKKAQKSDWEVLYHAMSQYHNPIDRLIEAHGTKSLIRALLRRHRVLTDLRGGKGKPKPDNQ